MKSFGRSDVICSARESSSERSPVTYLGRILIFALNFPATPVMSSTVAIVWTVILSFRRIRRTLISKPQVGGHIFGKYRCVRITRPPRNGSLSTRMTG